MLDVLVVEVAAPIQGLPQRLEFTLGSAGTMECACRFKPHGASSAT